MITPPNTTGLNTILRSVKAGRKPFRPAQGFIPTGFAERLISVLELALATRQWFVVCAQAGDGKTTTLRWFVRLHPALRNADGVLQLPVLATRVSTARSADALMYAIASPLGVLPNFKAARFREWLAYACFHAGVQLIVIDDAHELTAVQLDYLRELTDKIEGHGRRVAVVLLAATDSLDPDKQPLWKLISKHELTAEQFSRRTDGTDPLVLIESLSEAELGQVLLSFEGHYQSVFPDLKLARWTQSIFKWMIDKRIDKAGMGLVRMNSVCQIVYAALAKAQARDMSDIGDDGELLYEAALRLAVRGVAYAIVSARGDDDPPPAAPAVAVS